MGTEQEVLQHEKRNSVKLNVLVTVAIFAIVHFGGTVWWASGVDSDVKETKGSVAKKAEKSEVDKEFEIRDNRIASVEKGLDRVEKDLGKDINEIKDDLKAIRKILMKEYRDGG